MATKSGESGESGEIDKWRKFSPKVEKFISMIYTHTRILSES